MATIISEQIKSLINYRITQEEYSSRLYLAMSVWLKQNGYLGAGQLWEKYSKEELNHASWSYDYLLDLNIKPEIAQINAPQNEFKGLPQIIALSFKHEEAITKQCQELADACAKNSDYMTLNLAQKYLKEQVEEIKKITDIASQLEAFGTDPIALRLLDNQLAGQ